MNTNQLKKFAKQARIRLLEDVKNRFLYWGLDKAGNVQNKVETISGGYMFRGDVFNDESVPAKWNNLLAAVEHHTANDIIEEASYIWFNRLMAIKILEKNGYDSPILSFSDDQHDPVILQNAKRGNTPRMNDIDKRQLNEYLTQSKDDEALSLLLIHYCRNHKLLNKLFGQIDDYSELLLPNNLLAEEGIISQINSNEFITEEDYKEVELIGWLYQFYISDKKDDVFAGFKKKKKARAEDIPAATQIFTPKWIVKYLVENTVGRIWLDKNPESKIRNSMKYLVESENAEPCIPIISDVTELKALDPAVGSAHFLVVAFDLLMQMYKEEGYTNRYAVEAIITHNLYGLDICKRAVGLANFAVLLKAASYYPDILSKEFTPHIVAMPEPHEFNLQQIYDFLGEDGKQYAAELQKALSIMQQAQNIGSALIIDLSANARKFIEQRLGAFIEKQNQLEYFEEVLLNTFKPFLQPILMLTDLYPAVVANPPYMGSKNMNADLSNYVKKHYPKSKSDLFAVFMEVLPNLTIQNGNFGIINLPSWLFLSSFEKIRDDYVSNYFIMNMLHFGRGVFGIDWGSVAFTVQKSDCGKRTGKYFKLHERTFQHIHLEDIEKLFHYSYKNPDFKYDFKQYRDEDGVNEIPENGIESGQRIFYPLIPQTNFTKIPGSPIAYWVSEKIIEMFVNNESLKNKVDINVGLQTGNNNKFIRYWHEVNNHKIGFNFNNNLQAKNSLLKWFPFNKGGENIKWFGCLSFLINWNDDGKDVRKSKGSVIRNQEKFFMESISCSAISSSINSYRFYPNGAIFDINFRSIFIKEKGIKLFLLGLLNSKVVSFIFSILSPTMALNISDLENMPLIIKKKDYIIDMTDKNITISKSDWNSRETSWDFKQLPLINNSSTLIESYNMWKEEVTTDFFQLHANEEELNSIFIDIYGLQYELAPEVALKDITILQEELDRKQLEIRNDELRMTKSGLPIKKDVVIKQLLYYAVGCFMGRYRLDNPGLNIAHPNPTTEELAPYQYNDQSFEIDDDGIIPIMGSDSPFSDDIFRRVKTFVEIVWGEETLTENLNFINAALGSELEKYLTTKFWDDHKKTYKKKPIYWQFSSPKGAFKVLTYMHRMNRFTVQKVRTNYLFKQLNYLDQQIGTLEANEASLSNQESRQLDKLRSDLRECRDYDLLLKDFSDKQIEFDLDDGVTENYKLFDGVVKKI
jgi:hypothetical protein